MHPYINIHTHHLSKDNDLFLFNNRFGFEKELFTQNYFSVGIHPWDVSIIKPGYIKELEQVIQHNNCLAIGECGLDKLCKSDFRQQKHFFDAQLQLAVKYNKPVIIHCVKAYDEVVGISKNYIKKIPLIFHGFNKTDELAMQLLNKGFYISVSNSFLRKTKLPASVLNKLFFETDDLKDQSIIEVYKLFSQKFLITEDLLKEKISGNFTAVFKK